MNRFEYTERGFAKTLILIPGFGLDARIFNSLELEYNYLLADNLEPEGFVGALHESILRHGFEKISLLGWSMGGFLAAEFAAANPKLVERLILVSIRSCYPENEVEHVRASVLKNRAAYLRQFYNYCFPNQEERKRFFAELGNEYLASMSLDYLMRGLAYLKTAELTGKALQNIKVITIVHGENDRIAPLHEAKLICDEHPQARFVQLKNEGHLPLYSREFQAALR